jgi:deoxyribonuclease IV
MADLSFRFGTVGSPLSTPKRPGGSIGSIIRLRELEMDALELGWVNSVRVSEKTCAEIKAVAEEHNVCISVHAPYFINLNADEEEWPKSRKRLMDAAFYGWLAGATDIVFHPGSYFKLPPEEILPKAMARLQGCVDELRSNNVQVVLRPETMGKPVMIGSLEDTLVMSKEIRGVEPCLDFAHLHARACDGSMNTYDEWARVLEKYGTVLGEPALKRLHIHLSGIEYGLKGERNHLPLAEADIDIRGLFRALKDFKCGGRILSESPVMEEDALVMKDTWLDMANQG